MNRLLVILVSLVALACNTPVPPDFVHDAPTPAASERAPEPVSYPLVPVVSDPPAAALPPIRVYIDTDVSELDAVVEAVEAWRFVTRGIRDWLIVSEREGADVAIHEVGPYARVCPGAPVETTALGCVDQTGGLWWTREDDRPLRLFLISGNYEVAPKLTAMHELGHLLGLTHAAGGFMTGPMPADMMAADWECPDAEAVAELGERLNVQGFASCEAPTY
jgi:hypothetical protein